MRSEQDIASEVLQFYRELPFNYYSSAEAHAASIRGFDYLSSHPALEPLLTPGRRVLEVGCGTGGIANAMVYHHACDVLGIDFNLKAIARAKEVRDLLGISTKFAVADLFSFVPDTRYELVMSSGVLHCTGECEKGIRRLCRVFAADQAHVYIGLYHAYGRKAFTDFVRQMKDAGLPEREMFDRYVAIQTRQQDPLVLESWFRDQVLHPFETHHTLKEVDSILRAEGFRVTATSINEYGPAADMTSLFELEKTYESVGRGHLAAGRYFAGFFWVLAHRS